MATMLNDKKQLSDREIQAFVSLLEDSEKRTLNLIAKQVNQLDDFSLRYIDKIIEDSANEQLVDNWYYISNKSLGDQIQAWKKDCDLETGLFLLSRLRTPGILVDRYQAILDSYADRVTEKCSPADAPEKVIDAINQVLFFEEGYVGNQADYYNLDNNFIHTVIETKAGNPIMLSCLYLLVARRLGLDLSGVGTPGHFVVQFNDLLIDPFFAGREVTKEECIARAQELNVYWREDYLDPIEDHLIIARCIRNLIAIYKKLNDFEKAADATNILKLV